MVFAFIDCLNMKMNDFSPSLKVVSKEVCN